MEVSQTASTPAAEQGLPDITIYRLKPEMVERLNAVLNTIEWGEPYKTLLKPKMYFLDVGFFLSVQSFDTDTGMPREQHWNVSVPFSVVSLMNPKFMAAYARYHLLRLVEHELDESVRVDGVKVYHPHEGEGWNKVPIIL